MPWTKGIRLRLSGLQQRQWHSRPTSYAWSGAGTIDQVDVSVDGGDTWHAAHIEQPRDRFMWVRWSYRWDAAQKGVRTEWAGCSRTSRATTTCARILAPL
jgi:hypothetical protein